jgi:transcription elongation factor GreA
MADITYLSQEGFDRLNAELDDLKTRGRQEAARAIAEAREKGDLSENAEYHAAKDEQGHLERKINEREKALANARVLDPSQLDLTTATVLTKVTIKNLKNGKELAYHLVAESEADLKQRKISVASPIGEGLLGKKVGDIAKIQTPGGIMQFELMDISL